jgi:SprT-like family
MCELVKDDEGQFRRVKVKLSSALLQFRPRSDLVNTLLHEAIHAYFFITTVFGHVRDPNGGHGPGFQRLASAINKHGGYDITQFHEFHDEVDSFRRHVWKCDGPCQHQPPFYGVVKRVMNRPPGQTDPWWEKHEKECGGTYTKIAEPEKTKKQIAAMTGWERAGRQKNKLDSWLKKDDKLVVPKENTLTIPKVIPTSSSTIAGTKRARSTEGNDSDRMNREKMVDCPICSETVTESEINEHLDAEHPM